MTFYSIYASVSSTSPIAVDLLNLAMNQSSFAGSDYIIFCNAWGSYYIVWGDLEVSNGIVTGSDIQYFRYYCANTTEGIYQYASGSDSSFHLTLSDGAYTTSSLEGVGFASLAGAQYQYYANYKPYEPATVDSGFQVFSLAVLLVIMFCALRGTNK